MEQTGNSHDGKRTSSLKFIKEKGAKCLIKEISQKVKPVNSENFQPQRTVHPTATCLYHGAGSTDLSWGSGSDSPLTGSLSWREVESLIYLVPAFTTFQ